MTRLFPAVLEMTGVDGAELVILFGVSFLSFWRLFGGGVCCAIAKKRWEGSPRMLLKRVDEGELFFLLPSMGGGTWWCSKGGRGAVKGFKSFAAIFLEEKRREKRALSKNQKSFSYVIHTNFETVL